MANPLYQMLQGMVQQRTNPVNDLLGQVRMLQNNPAAILDILARSGKISPQQYNELQQFKDNPQQIVNYLITHGNASQIDQARQQAGQFYNNYIN